MVIRNEVKVMLFRLSAPRIFDQDRRGVPTILCHTHCFVPVSFAQFSYFLQGEIQFNKTKKTISILFSNLRTFCIVDFKNINSQFVTGTL
jgi:hypothetical protein